MIKIRIYNAFATCLVRTIVKPTQKVSADLPVEPEKTELIRSADLFGTGKRLRIEHQGLEYLLQITRQGKLILTR
jgi:hemin uptake protein HemP